MSAIRINCPALTTKAGSPALARIRERGLQPADVGILPGAAGGASFRFDPDDHARGARHPRRRPRPLPAPCRCGTGPLNLYASADALGYPQRCVPAYAAVVAEDRAMSVGPWYQRYTPLCHLAYRDDRHLQNYAVHYLRQMLTACRLEADQG